MNDYQKFIALSRYARWMPDVERRETWEDSVDRYMENVVYDDLIPEGHTGVFTELYQAILNLEVMPSMRAMMTAGTAMDRDNTAAYNCSYLIVDDVKAFDEAMFILLTGCGVGFSVERQYICKLPEIPDELYQSETTVVVKDSKEGWSKAYRQLLSLLYAGEIPKIDVTRVRPAGSRLKTFGGRASGPQPLVDLFDFSIGIFQGAIGRRLTSIECHDLMCKIGDIVVVGGVRRSAMISLSNLSDERMRHAKSGEFPGHRRLANNSVAYTEKPDLETFLREWLSLIESNTGERGVFSRVASRRQVEKYGRRDPDHDWGTNPCSEIILRPYQFCNLTEVVVRAEDTLADLRRKVRLATILGTIQSTYTKFPYLRKIWQRNTEEERLLGVSLTGIMDNPITMGRGFVLGEVLDELRGVAVATNAEWADILGVSPSAAITCVKPSGTVSQLVDSSSGIHTRHSPYYIRTVRGDTKDPLTKLMIDQGIPNEPDVHAPDSTVVFSFPMKSPEEALCRDDLDALDQLNYWLIYQRHWCEHKPSITVTVKKDEWLEAGAFVYKHFDEMSGVSFLPYDGGKYTQAPYQEIDKEKYEELHEAFPKNVDWSKLDDYEKEDNTVAAQTMACSAGYCELVDIGS